MIGSIKWRGAGKGYQVLRYFRVAETELLASRDVEIESRHHQPTTED